MSATALPDAAAAASSTSPASTSTPKRNGGVGAGLATAAWWEHYYSQQHDTYWDWYLPNELVVEALQREARVQTKTLEPKTKAGDEDEEQQEDAEANADSLWVSADSAIARSRLASLPALQLGCGNSEITALLWEAGWRCMHNVDFSPGCIERMQVIQKEKGWLTTDSILTRAREEAIQNAKTRLGVQDPAVIDAHAQTVGAGFSFSVADVREMKQYPDGCFGVVFDKGTLDCVSLESEGDLHAASVQMLREVHRTLRPGGVSVCFSLYPPSARAKFWFEAIPASEGGETKDELAELEELLGTDNPPTVLRNLAAWSEFRMHALDLSPLEMPNQKHTYLYVAIKR